MVLSELRSGIQTITLNRPQAANAIGPDQRETLIRLLAEAGANPEVRVVVLKANGKQFCSGADVANIGRNVERTVGDVMQVMLDGAQRLITAVLDCRKPVIASVQGAAAGLGAHLAYASDLVIASEQASFIEAFLLRGLALDAAGAYLLPRRIGLQKAKELVFFGDRLSAADAMGLGLVNRVVPAAELDAEVGRWADRLAAAPTVAISLSKRLLNRSLDSDRNTAFVEEAMVQELNSGAQDVKEGVTAFMERRTASFKGR